MKKKIEMSLETARQMYKEGNETTNKWLLENFTKEELEPNRGFTWEDSFNKRGFIVSNWFIYMVGELISNENKSVLLTENHAKSALAFAQLSHIVSRYNQNHSPGDWAYCVKNYKDKLVVEPVCEYIYPLSFYTMQDADLSMEVNRQLWLDYWMID